MAKTKLQELHDKYGHLWVEISLDGPTSNEKFDYCILPGCKTVRMRSIDILQDVKTELFDDNKTANKI